ncbi:hypothetical protein JQC72_10085 [Polycladomyces sp. WAk]|uniref:Uncharacterized protein n=1 Tax=Polycladomyces zharkentensis TaxID=2807616 RepID=A0ABS2WK30_9BACL|nr:hypothetical protein [Polycladomyces sp. WAk]MBN2909873.1 hypothetical protein [Polycladomyces sp. WAk]
MKTDHFHGSRYAYHDALKLDKELVSFGKIASIISDADGDVVAIDLIHCSGQSCKAIQEKPSLAHSLTIK